MQSNDKFEELFSQEDAFPFSDLVWCPVDGEAEDNDDHSSAADLMNEIQAAAESGTLATFRRFDVVLNNSSHISVGAERSSAKGQASASSHQISVEGQSNANRVEQFLDEKVRAGPPSHRLLQIAEYPTSGTGHNEAMRYRSPNQATGCKSKRQSTPPSQPAPKGRVRGIKDSGGAESAILQRDRHSPGRQQVSNHQVPGATPHQQTAYSRSQQRSPTPLVVYNNPSEPQSADNPRRSDLVTPPPGSDRRLDRASSRAARRRPAFTETTSTLSTAPKSTRSSNSRRSKTMTDMTSEQSLAGIGSAADLVTATSNLTVTSPARTRSDVEETRYPCPYSLRYPGRGDKQRCAGERADGFGGMGHVKDHIERAHLKQPLTCDILACPKRGQDLWRACLEGKSIAEKIRLQNGCPHINLDEKDYIWQEKWKDICKRAKSLQKVARWKFFYQELFPGQPIPDPLNPQGPTTPDFRQQESNALDAISRRAFADHDEEVWKSVRSEVASVTDDPDLQSKILDLIQSKQKQVRGD